VALTVGTGIGCDDGVSSLVQVTNATTASKDGTSAGTDGMTTLSHAPKRTKKSGIEKGQASPMVERGRVEHNQNAGKKGKNSEWPWFNGTFADYDTFKANWESYLKNHKQLKSQGEIVQLFRGKCMSEKTASRLGNADSMTAAWAELDKHYYVTEDLMWEFKELPRIKKRRFERQYNHYFLIQYSASAAYEAKQEHLLLVPENIDKMLGALPQREQTLWMEAQKQTAFKDLGVAFTAFVEERLEWSFTQMTGMKGNQTEPAPAPTGAPERGDRREYGGGANRKSDRSIHVMAIQSLNMTQPPAQTKWDDTLPWIHPCAISKDGSEVYPPLHHVDFEKPGPKANQALARTTDEGRRNLNL
jgi:hypothetical protein